MRWNLCTNILRRVMLRIHFLAFTGLASAQRSNSRAVYGAAKRTNQTRRSQHTSAACGLLYVDLGANNGDTLERFVGAPSKDTGDFAFVRRLLDAASPGWSSATSCIYAFEASPRWTTRLNAVAEALRPRVRDIRVYTETAIFADRRRESVTLQTDKRTQNGVGTSVSSSAARRSTVRVRTRNLADWLSSRILGAHRDVPCVIRMDIEGEEYDTLKDLIISGTPRRLAAQGISTSIGIEWHRFAKDKVLGDLQLRYMSKLDHAFHWSAPITRGMLNKQAEKMITYWLAGANVSTSDRYGQIHLQGGYTKEYLRNDPMENAASKTTEISQAEFDAAVTHG